MPAKKVVAEVVAENVGEAIVAAQVDGKKLLKEFVEYRNAFNVFSERSRELDQLMYAVLTKEHVLFKGVPGTAKSEMTKAFLSGFTSSKMFSQQFTAFMDESYVFGPPLIEELKKGLVMHNVTDSLADCQFAFLDEFFNANEELIISCNEVLNERSFTRNAQRVVSPLITAVMTTNQSREDEKKLKPIYDRIMFTSQVKRVVESRREMYHNALSGKLKVTATFPIEKLKQLHAYLSTVKVFVSDGIIEAMDMFLAEYQKQANVFISDRKAVKSLYFLRAVAVVNGKDRVSLDDLKQLKLIWTEVNNPAQESCFDAVFVGIEKEYAKIEKAAAFLSSVQTTFKNIETDMANMVGFKDAKKIHIAAESLMNDIASKKEGYGHVELQILEKTTEKLKLILETTEENMHQFKASNNDEIQPEDFDWFKNLTEKSGDSDKEA